MARRTHLVQVTQELTSTKDLETARDPVCGAEGKRRDFKTILFRRDQTIYFCSKDCLGQYLRPAQEKKRVA